jgi:hypothetical protein
VVSATATPSAPSVTEFARTLESVTEQAGSVEFSGDVVTAAGTAAVSGRFTPDGGPGSLFVATELAEIGPVEVIVTGGAVYYRNPELPDPVPGRPWVRVAPDEVAPDVAAVVSAVSSSVGFGSLVGLASAATLTGPADEPVDGVPARRSDVQVDLAAAAASDQPDVAALAAAAAAGGTTAIHTVYWLDPAGLPVAVEQRAESASGTSTAGSTLRYTGWGSAAAVTAPPDAEVVDGADLA